ncbi:MAG: acetyl-CoA decarbonylase/synthase complex subunit delta [Terriglobia bacterium]
MAFEEPIQSYSGKLRELVVGSDDDAVRIGGASTLPCYLFEGELPHHPVVAMEVYDRAPEGWPKALMESLGEAVQDPVEWAKRCANEFGADLICLQLASTDPNGDDSSVDDAIKTVRAVADAVEKPLVILGSGHVEKDQEILKKAADATSGRNFLLGPAVDENYKVIGAASLAYGHNLIGQTPNDVNMAKQLNILITQLGLAPEKVAVDPTTGALGYGLEYTYSVIERLQLAALQQNDEMAQMPVISDLGKEVWKTKETKVDESEEPSWGDAEKRGILWEALTAVTLMVAGSNILVMRHPEAVELVLKTMRKLSLRD